MRRSELQDGVRLVPLGPMCVPEAHSSARGLVGRTNLTPLMGRDFEAAPSAGAVTCRQSYLSEREGRAGRQRLAFEDCRDAGELVGGRLGPVEIPSGDLDLHLRLEDRRPTEVGIGRQLLRWNG